MSTAGTYYSDGEFAGLDEQGVERAYIWIRFHNSYDGWNVRVNNSKGLFIGNTQLSDKEYQYYRLVFQQLSTGCPANITVDRKSLQVLAFTAACDPYK